MAKNPKVERLAKQKMKKAISPDTATWGSLRAEAALKQYYRDQARQELNLPRAEAWEITHPR